MNWLDAHDGYATTMEVFEGGSSKDIASLMKVYQGVEFNQTV